jgi:hypothetical protein
MLLPLPPSKEYLEPLGDSLETRYWLKPGSGGLLDDFLNARYHAGKKL